MNSAGQWRKLSMCTQCMLVCQVFSRLHATHPVALPQAQLAVMTENGLLALTWRCIVPRGVLDPHRGRAQRPKVHMLPFYGQVMLPQWVEPRKLRILHTTAHRPMHVPHATQSWEGPGS